MLGLLLIPCNRYQKWPNILTITTFAGARRVGRAGECGSADTASDLSKCATRTRACVRPNVRTGTLPPSARSPTLSGPSNFMPLSQPPGSRCMSLLGAASQPRHLYLSIYLSIYRSIDPSIYRSIDLSIYRSIDRSIYLCIYIYIYSGMFGRREPQEGLQARLGLPRRQLAHQFLDPCVCVYVYVYVCICIYIYIYTHVCIYIYT